MRVAVRVVLPDRDDRERRVHSVDESGAAVAGTVVGDLEDVGLECGSIGLTTNQTVGAVLLEITG